MTSIFKAVSSLAVFLLLCSCTTVHVYQYQYDSTLDEVFVNQDADLSRYSAVIIQPISVWHPDEYAPSPENIERAQANLAHAQELFKKTIAEALPDGFSVTDTPGRNVLSLHVEFVDLRALPEDGDVPQDLARYEFKTRPGHITMVGQLLDSLSGKQLARAADLGKEQSVGGNGVVDWSAIAADFQYWGNVFGAWLEKNTAR